MSQHGSHSDGCRPFRLGYLVSHPIQYQAPLLRRIAADPRFDLQVLFLSDVSVKPYRDAGFGREVSWDVDLLSGYEHRFLGTVGRSDRLTNLRPLNRGVERAVLEADLDALWIHGYAHPSNLRALFAAKRAGVPVFLRGESLPESKARGGWRARLRQALVRPILERVDACLAIGSDNADFYRDFGVAEERIHLVPYAVDNQRFEDDAAAASPNREELRRQLDLTPERPLIAYASKFIERKRADLLLESFADLLRRRKLESAPPLPRPQLLLAGDGELRATLEARVAELDLQEDVRFPGFFNQSELPALYDLADVFVLPSRYEPWGLVVNEAMCAGTPVIVADAVGSARDLVHHGRTGWCFETDDRRDLTRCLDEATRDPRHTARVGRAARERVRSWSFAEDLAGLAAACSSVGAFPDAAPSPTVLEAAA